jgi:CMP-N,N'-diacetyllegionaminic acid synthase
MSRILAVIPARGGSKGVPGKNVKEIHGRPLIAWSIMQAQAAGIDRVVVSTDDSAIAAVARENGAEVPFVRPAALSTDTAATEPVVLHAIDWYADHGCTFDIVLLLQPTSPLRFRDSIPNAIARFNETRADSLLGVCENHHFFWRNGTSPEALYDYRRRPRRQDIRDEDRMYRENGSLYLTRVEAFRASGNRLCGQIVLFPMREEEGLEIDSHIDFKMVESVMKAIEFQ